MHKEKKIFLVIYKEFSTEKPQILRYFIKTIKVHNKELKLHGNVKFLDAYLRKYYYQPLIRHKKKYQYNIISQISFFNAQEFN